MTVTIEINPEPKAVYISIVVNDASIDVKFFIRNTTVVPSYPKESAR